MRILLTGSGGYIGSVLSQELSGNGYEVIPFDVKDGHDVLNATDLQYFIDQCDVVIHLAGIADPKECEENKDISESINYKSVRLLNCLRGERPILFPNTNIGYRSPERISLYDETIPMRPISHYGKCKYAAEKDIIETGNYVVLRLSSCLGVSPFMQGHLLTHFYIKEAVARKRIDVYQGHFLRNFIHVRDVARAFVHSLKNYDAMKNQIYNVGLTEHISKSVLAELIADKVGSVEITKTEGEDVDERDYIISSLKIKQTGFFPKITLEDGIDEVIDYYRNIQ